MKSAFFSFLALVTILVACRKTEDVTEDYRDNFTGSYSGDYYYHITYPQWVDSTTGWTTFSQTTYDEGVIHVSKGECDSCMLLELELKLDPSENWSKEFTLHSDSTIFTASGGGSTLQYTDIKLFGDSLYMYDFAKCGMACDSWRVLTSTK